MKIPSVEINNFMGIGHAHLDLSGKGLVLIQGENFDDTSADSNGAGKSTMPDALFWCLFGSTARDKLGADEVVNRTAKKDTWVEAKVEQDDGSFYMVKRWRKLSGVAKKNGVSLIFTDATGVSTDLTKGTDVLTQVEIDKALGCSEEVFTAAVYAGQEKLPNLPSATDGDLKRLIEEASGVTVLVKSYEIARARLKDSERKLDTWRLGHSRVERDVTDARAKLAELTQRRDGYETKRKTEIGILRTDLAAAVAKARARQAARDAIKVPETDKAIAALDEKIDAVHAENNRETDLLTEERALAGRVSTARSAYDKKVATATTQRAELDNIQARIGTPCKTCTKPYVEADLGPAKEVAKETIRKTVTDAREIASDVEALQGLHKVAVEALATFRASKTDIRATVEERKRLAETLAQRQRDDQGVVSETALAQRIKDDLDKKLAETNPYVDLADTCAREVTEAVATFQASEVEGAVFERQIMVGKDVAKVFGPAGVRAHILDTVTPLLNDRTAEYLGTLSDGRISAVWATLVPNAKGEMTEKFSITVEKEGDGGSHAALSGGEKRKVRLATALALQDLVASRATKPLALWIGDEIDDALDDPGLERLMTVLENKARERGTVLVISHNSLNDWIRDTTTVTRKGGYSTIAGVLEHV